jgi:hypothetical protein
MQSRDIASSRRSLLIFSSLSLATSFINVFPATIRSLGIDLRGREPLILLVLGVVTVVSLLSFESRIIDSGMYQANEGGSGLSPGIFKVGLSFYLTEIFLPKVVALCALGALLCVHPEHSPFYAAWKPLEDRLGVMLGESFQALSAMAAEDPAVTSYAVTGLVLILFWRNELFAAIKGLFSVVFVIGFLLAVALVGAARILWAWFSSLPSTAGGRPSLPRRREKHHGADETNTRP